MGFLDWDASRRGTEEHDSFCLTVMAASSLASQLDPWHGSCNSFDTKNPA